MSHSNPIRKKSNRQAYTITEKNTRKIYSVHCGKPYFYHRYVDYNQGRTTLQQMSIQK